MNQSVKSGGHIWHWQDWRNWRLQVLQLAAGLWGTELPERVRMNPPGLVLVRDLEWIRPYLQGELGVRTSSQLSQDFAELMAVTWTHLRAFHGCSAVDISSYYRWGIRPINLEQINRWAEDYFCRVCPKLDRRDVIRAKSGLSGDYGPADQRVFFSIDPQHLLEYCGHYMIYGSEYLLILASQLNSFNRAAQGCNFRQHLRGRGEPTVLVCDVPVERIDGPSRDELGRILLAEAFKSICDPQRIPGSRRFGFAIEGILQPEQIRDHFLPVGLTDHLNPLLGPAPACQDCQSPKI